MSLSIRLEVMVARVKIKQQWTLRKSINEERRRSISTIARQSLIYINADNRLNEDTLVANLHKLT